MTQQRFYSLISIGAVFALSLFVSACDIFAPEPLTIPASYDSTNFRANAAAELRLKATFAAMLDSIRAGRADGYNINEQTLQTAYSSGSPSISSLTTALHRPRITTYITELAKASGGSYDPTRTPAQNGQGGVFSAGTARYLLDENGLELGEMIEKAVYGAMHYNQAVTLLTGDATPANVDRALALFGATPAFRNSDNATRHGDVRDMFLAAYAARRCDNTPNGIYRRIQANFIKLQAAVKAGSRYNADRIAATDSLLLNWERANAATAINYCLTVTSTMSKTTTTKEDHARSLHSYSEGVALLSGLRTVSRRRITDAQLDRLLTLLKAPFDGTPTSYQLITEPVAFLANMQTVVSELRSIYGFSDAEMELFRRNLVNEQMR